MKRYSGLSKFGTIAFSVVMLLAGKASAFDEQRNRSWGDSFGNSNAGGTLRYDAKQRNGGGIAPMGPTMAKFIISQARQNFEASASLNGTKYTALSFSSWGQGMWSQRITPSVGDEVITQSATTELVVFGSETTGTEAACGASGKQICSTLAPWSKSGTRKLVDTIVVVGFVPVNLRGQLGYSIGTELTAFGNGGKYLGLKSSFFGGSKATTNATAKLTGQFWICSPHCDFGFSAKVDLLIASASVTPTTWGRMSASYTPTGDASFSYGNTGPATVRTLDGNFTLGIDLGFTDYTWNIVKWNGYSWTKNLWADEGNGKCADWTVDLKTCKDIVND